MNPSQDTSFDYVDRASANGGFSNTGLELTPDNFDFENQENPFENQLPRESFTNDAPNLPISKYSFKKYLRE